MHRLSEADYSLMWVGLVQSVEELHRTKRLSKRKLLLPDCLQARALLFFLPLDSVWNAGSSSLPAFELELYHQLSWVSSLPTANLGISHLQNWVSQFLIINLYLWNFTHGVYTCKILPPTFLSTTFCPVTLWNYESPLSYKNKYDHENRQTLMGTYSSSSTLLRVLYLPLQAMQKYRKKWREGEWHKAQEGGMRTLAAA